MLLNAVIATMLSLSAEPARATTTKVNIDGSTYRVRVRGSEVEVASKSLIAIKSLTNRDRMRRAVTKATGCQITDELLVSTSILQGRLACAD